MRLPTIILRPDPVDAITVPDKVRKRARKALAMGDPTTWIEQTLYLIGQNINHHRPGDPRLDEAVRAAESLLALLVEMQKIESPSEPWKIS